MKKLILAIVAVGAILFTSNLFAEEAILKIANMQGKVLVKIAPSAGWADAKMGQALLPKDAVKTEADGKVYLEFPDKSSFSLKPNSEMLVEDIAWSATARKVSVNLSAGELKTIIKKLDSPSDFKVRTPTAICGARGTIFYVIVHNGETRVYTEEGLIDFLSSIGAQSYQVVAGFSSFADLDGNIKIPEELSPEELAELTSGYSTILVVEPYTEGGGEEPAGGDITPPESESEEQASET